MTPEQYQAILDETVKEFRADSGTIHLLEADGLLHLKAHTAGLPEKLLDIVRVIPVGKGMAGLAAERAEPVTACNIQSDSSGNVRPGAKITGMEGALVVPVLKDGKAVGALGIANRTERTFSEAEVARLLEIGRSLA